MAERTPVNEQEEQLVAAAIDLSSQRKTIQKLKIDLNQAEDARRRADADARVHAETARHEREAKEHLQHELATAKSAAADARVETSRCRRALEDGHRMLEGEQLVLEECRRALANEEREHQATAERGLALIKKFDSQRAEIDALRAENDRLLQMARAGSAAPAAAPAANAAGGGMVMLGKRMAEGAASHASEGRGSSCSGGEGSDEEVEGGEDSSGSSSSDDDKGKTRGGWLSSLFVRRKRPRT